MLAPWIVSQFPKHRIYVEPFGGGGSVLMRKERSYAEVYNDRWGRVVDVFHVLRDRGSADELQRRLELTPFARDDFEAVTEDFLSTVECPIERARLTIFRSFAGFGSASTNGSYATGFRANSNKSGTTPAHDWVNFPAEIDTFVERLKGVVIENRDAMDIVRQHDTAETLHYLDPPYPHSTRNMARGNAAYAFEMTDDDHRALADVVKALEGMVVISGYACDLYDIELFAEWERIERKAMADGARERCEVLWFNQAATEARKRDQLPLFDA